MGETSEKKHICIGILAHVDAGKTTLAEGILYRSGSIRKLGRVDHGDAFLDTYALERSRGITIFSKQAELALDKLSITLLDTPGHVDFSAEMERTLQVMDYGILVISGADGIQGHVLTLWRLLKRHRIPVFLFINKMDQEGTDRQRLLAELNDRLSERCVDFSESQDSGIFMENLAMCDENLLDSFLELGYIEAEKIISAISDRKVFPCYFGSALKMQGVDALLGGIEKYAQMPSYREEFGARIYKISRDAHGSRLTHMKITGGALKVKMPLENGEKVDQIRIYSGAGFETVDEVGAGRICAVTGLSKTRTGQGLGFEGRGAAPVLEPVLTYQIKLPEGTNVHDMFLKLKQLEEEEPQLQIVWNEELGEIHAKVMGEIQIEILKSLIAERFQVDVDFGTGNIVYKETIETMAEGVGHYEPLRHYAEVHLLLEPGKPGSGLVFESRCSEDDLDRNWQRLILTHLAEKIHRGVLIGAEITDMKISLVSGRAHTKHTEGGDFRQATYRAVRHGLKRARSVLLEPIYEYCLEIPSDKVGRAMADIQKMQGTFSAPKTEGNMTVITGTAPVVNMREYTSEVIAYTKGMGKLTCTPGGYAPCHNAEEVIEAAGYDSETDLDNPTGSIFCSHGAGVNVPWNEVTDYMHLESFLKASVETWTEENVGDKERESSGGGVMRSGLAEDKELEQIFERTYGPVKRKEWRRTETCGGIERKPEKKPEENYLLVDGYNIIFSWDELRDLSEVNITSARNALMDILCNYQGFRKDTLILVFDAYKVEGNPGQVFKYHNIYVVYTKEAETADQYIEKTVHRMNRKYQVTVATSDALEQVIILGQGAQRLSAQGLKDEVEQTGREIRQILDERRENDRNYLLNALPEDMVDLVEDIRLGKKQFK
ncbi:TetM/TetW/TetO/TetS family tetracycline resistance ribosomal protection protein [Frisingicoccus caecimuris]|uniref:Small GTP-binding protein n=1 Tax=Frisingicoccus caecimuris TaxID=1796636 RepID=A0A4R2L881_9FIRM|nr:TetM/TetW/TetO/TetS family tetracycline resistance ribosomal protection protein [Frisingicoccus caecimuris]MCR1918918.1 TetM/TetW/TetO/TetS family tetracycline resistance ribosomal protection protein [Frisingicoccus caecimuris]TCO82866.1 small GTP-binding protein [Frisingicoccus caecimuris]